MASKWLTEPQGIDVLEGMLVRQPMLVVGESWFSRGQRYYRFMVLNREKEETACNAITAATLQLLRQGAVVEEIAMVQGNKPAGPPPDPRPPAAGDTAPPISRRMDGGTAGVKVKPSAPEDRQWWTDWVELTGDLGVQAVVTYAGGEQQVVASGEIEAAQRQQSR